jgi:hypothetical protein
MKKLLPILAIAIVFAACNHKVDQQPAAAATQQQANMPDTAGLSDYYSWKAQNELAAVKPVQQVQATAAAPVVTRTIIKRVPVSSPAKSSSTSSSSSNNTDASSGSGTMSSGSEQTAKVEQKKGWSKAAKGAVIGGVVGAAGGAVINKKNRVLGAVIGGVVGAAGGYGIGKGMDKKDGRIDLAMD